MKAHSTNYENTFIEIADDCPVEFGEIPPAKGDTKTVANIQFDLLSKNPYKFTSDDILFEVFAKRNDLTKSELKSAREEYFSKGQACFRASPLTKRYGWGIHNDKNGKIALIGCETPEYKKLSRDKRLKIVKALKSNK
ncbi:MAG: DUF6157 family protein [Ferruginibacter sp.]